MKELEDILIEKLKKTDVNDPKFWDILDELRENEFYLFHLPTIRQNKFWWL